MVAHQAITKQINRNASADIASTKASKSPGLRRTASPRFARFKAEDHIPPSEARGIRGMPPPYATAIPVQ
jgi:hypothetical protein